MKLFTTARSRSVPAVLVGGLLIAVFIARDTAGSDHQQTAFTELNPRLDITDVWAFPGSTDSRIVLAMTVASPIVGTAGARFDPNALYEFKVDNNQDGRADIVLQVIFDDLSDGTQRVNVLGPAVALPDTMLPGPISGFFPGGIGNRVLGITPSIVRGALNATVTADLPAAGGGLAGQLQVFAGLRDDPFFVDAEQFFMILPDRRPVSGPLSAIPAFTGVNKFRPPCDANGQPPANPGVFDGSRGCARDGNFGFNALAIIVELPETQLTRGVGTGQIGVWATISR